MQRTYLPTPNKSSLRVQLIRFHSLFRIIMVSCFGADGNAPCNTVRQATRTSFSVTISIHQQLWNQTLLVNKKSCAKPIAIKLFWLQISKALSPKRRLRSPFRVSTTTSNVHKWTLQCKLLFKHIMLPTVVSFIAQSTSMNSVWKWSSLTHWTNV